MRAFFLSVTLVFLAMTAQAQDKPAIERQFQSWIQSEIWPRARAKGVSRAKVADLMEVDGVNEALAERIWGHFNSG